MKALSKRHEVDYFVHTGDVESLNIWLKSRGMVLIKEVVWRDNTIIAKLRDHDKTFFNHFVIEDGRFYKMTAEQFMADYLPIH